MAASDKNKEYQDQVYYAIGNIHLAQKDTCVPSMPTKKATGRLPETV